MKAEAKECQHALRIAAAQADARGIPSSATDEAAGKNGDASAGSSTTVADAANKKLTRKKMISFASPADGWAVVVQSKCSDSVLLNTYEQVLQDLFRVKIIVEQNKGNITADELRERLRERCPDTYLYPAAGSNDWLQFVDDFRPAPQIGQSKKHRTQPGSKKPTVESVAWCFLARAIDVKPVTIEKRLSQARTRKKRKKTRGATLGNFG